MAERRSVMFVSPIPMIGGSNPRPVSLIVEGERLVVGDGR